MKKERSSIWIFFLGWKAIWRTNQLARSLGRRLWPSLVSAGIPNRVLWRGCRKPDGFLLDRMFQLQVPGMQVNTAIFVAAVRPIFQVPLDVASHGRQLRPDLVVPPGL